MTSLVASCHCGRATIRLPRTPESVTQCNCSLCAKTGFRGVYFPSDELEIEGEFDSYVRDDLKQAYLANHRCAHCGIPTHWTPLGEPPHDRVGVNARLIDQAMLDGVPVQEVDGASWDE
ncbi:MAG TPA: GFA family protein [Sphingomicrobium sp.]|nr:GFA family protein [Sphingomicrobium sp.]